MSNINKQETDTIESNKLIAVFMGAQLRHYNVTGNEYYRFPNKHHELPEQLKYHSSWDWLMPVVQKIEYDEKFATMLYVNTWDNRGKYCFSVYRELDENSNIRHCFIEYCGNNKLNVIWTAVLEFIRIKNSSLLPYSEEDFHKNYLTYRKYIDDLQYAE